MTSARAPGRWVEAGVVTAALAIFLALAHGEARHQSPTVDEFHLVPQAVTLRATGDLELGVKTPPLIKRWIGLALDPDEVNLVDHHVNGRPAMDGWEPWIFATQFMGQNRAGFDALYGRARRMMLPLGAALGLLLWAWARRIAGRRAGVFAVVLFAFSPELIAFTSIVSLDLAVTATLVGSLFALREYLARDRWPALVASAVCLGLALSVKFAVIIVLPVYALLLVPRGERGGWGRRLVSIASLALVATLTLHATFGFRDPLPSVGDLPAVSERFAALHETLPAGLPLPFPLAWLQGIDLQGKDVQVADIPSYLDGEWSTAGWPHYYLLAWLYKTPLALLALVVVLVAGAVAAGRGAKPAVPRSLPSWLDAALLVGPFVLWGGVFSLTGKLNIGVRYVLPCYALAIVVLAALAARPRPRSVWSRTAAVLLAAFAASSAWAYPHHLGYFNALAGGRAGGYRHLIDSNVDWGQELKHLAVYLEERGIDRIGLAYFGHAAPEFYGIRYFVPKGEPAPGWYAVSVNFLAGYSYVVLDNGTIVPVSGERFAAFRDLEPVDTIAGALNVYRVER